MHVRVGVHGVAVTMLVLVLDVVVVVTGVSVDVDLAVVLVLVAVGVIVGLVIGHAASLVRTQVFYPSRLAGSRSGQYGV